MKQGTARGFTLIEVIVVLVLLISLLGATVLLLRPKTFEAADSDADRRLGLAAVAQALQEFRQSSGSYPIAIPPEATGISNQDGAYNLCGMLVPKYLKDIPTDPQFGTVFEGDITAPEPVAKPCTAPGVTYISGYSIKQLADGSLVLGAINSQLKPLEITVR